MARFTLRLGASACNDIAMMTSGATPAFFRATIPSSETSQAQRRSSIILVICAGLKPARVNF